MSSPSNSLLQRISTYLFAFFALLIATTMFSCIFGNVTGTEFNPYTFKSRNFNYTEVPLVHFQLRPTVRTAETNALQDWVTQDAKLLATSTDSRWDLVEGMRLGVSAQVDRSKTLYEYLNASDHEGELVWLAWSKAHRNSARKLWPALAWLGQSDLYYLIPDVMNLAKREGGSDQFGSLLDAELVKLANEAANKLGEVDPERAAAIESDIEAKRWRSLERTREPATELPAEADDPNASTAPPGS